MDHPSGDIFQPVLQWGKSNAGGGNFWAVACWFIDDSGNAFYHDPVPVSSGQTLTGVMTLTAQSGSLFSYDCFFQGISGTDLTIQNIGQLFDASETLECYRLEQASDYPNSIATAMTAIEIKTGGVDVSPNWVPQNRVTDCGQHTNIISDASPGGEVDLDYGFTQNLVGKVILGDTSDTNPALTWHDGQLFLAWKGSGNDNLSVMRSIDLGANFIQKIISPETSDAAPCLTSHNGALFIAWKGSGNDNLSVAQVALDGSLAPQGLFGKVILGDTSSAGPALASHDGLLFIAWKGSGNDNLSVMFSTDNGKTFPETLKFISSETSDAAPALVSHNGHLFIAWKGSGNDNLSVAQVNLFADSQGHIGIEGFTGKVILGETSSAGPALSSNNGMLVLSWKGSGNPSLSVLLSPDNGQTFVGKLISESSDAAPALAAQLGRLRLAWKGSGNDNLSVARLELSGDTALLPLVRPVSLGTEPRWIGPSADGRLELFAVAKDGGLWHTWQTALSNGWNGPPILHGKPARTNLVGAPVVRASADGRLEVFVVGADGGLYHSWQTAASNGWSQLVLHDRPANGLVGSPALAPSGDGRLEMFVVGADGGLYHGWQTAPSNGWNGQLVLHDRPGRGLIGSPALAPGADTRLEVFATGADGALYHGWQIAPSNGWNGPMLLHGKPAGTYLVGSPAVAASADGRLEFFVVGADGGLYHGWQTATNNGWNGPLVFHGQPAGLRLQGCPAIAASADGRLEIFVVGMDGGLYHGWQTVASNGWNGPLILHDKPRSTNLVGSPAIAASGDGRLEVFVAGADGGLYHGWQIFPSNGWNGPLVLHGFPLGTTLAPQLI
jgi:hypothetical protein